MDVDAGFRCCAVATSRNKITVYPLRPDSESIIALPMSKQFSYALVCTSVLDTRIAPPDPPGPPSRTHLNPPMQDHFLL